MSNMREYMSGELVVAGAGIDFHRDISDPNEDVLDGRIKGKAMAKDLATSYPGTMVIVALHKDADDSNDDVWTCVILNGLVVEFTGSDDAITETLEHIMAVLVDVGDNQMAMDLLKSARPDPGCEIKYSFIDDDA